MEADFLLLFNITIDIDYFGINSLQVFIMKYDLQIVFFILIEKNLFLFYLFWRNFIDSKLIKEYYINYNFKIYFKIARFILDYYNLVVITDNLQEQFNKIAVDKDFIISSISNFNYL